MCVHAPKTQEIYYCERQHPIGMADELVSPTIATIYIMCSAGVGEVIGSRTHAKEAFDC